VLRRSTLLKKIDYTLVMAVGIVVLYSLVVIYSATKPVELLSADDIVGKSGDSFAFVKKQVLWILLGIVAMMAMISIRYEDLARHVRFLYIFNLFVLAAVVFIGHSTLGAQRWISLGPFRFQPSEFSKLIVIICFAVFLAAREGKLNSLRDLLPCFVFISVPMLLVLKQPDLGTSLVFIAIMFGMLFAAGARPALLLGVIFSVVLLVGSWLWAHYWLEVNHGFNLWIPLQEYQFQRLIIFLNPWSDWYGSGYHIIQSQIAIGQGGFWGRGLFQGSQTHGNFLPIQETDFIFSVVGEELGFIGAFILLALYFIILYRGILIAAGAQDMLGNLLAGGIVSMLAFHVLVNVGMTIGIMPVTGIPLPLFSYGGSNMITNMAALGLLLNIGMRGKKILF